MCTEFRCYIKHHLNPFNHLFIVIFAIGDTWQASANLTPMAGGLHTCFYQKAGDSLQIGVELEGSLRTQECTATVGYQIELPNANLTFKGRQSVLYIIVYCLHE